jgi:hypothetical protein
VQINRILIWSLWANLSLSFSVSTGNCDSGIPGSSQVGTFRAVASSLSRAMTGFCKISYKKRPINKILNIVGEDKHNNSRKIENN